MLELPRVSQDEASILLLIAWPNEHSKLKFYLLVVGLQGNQVCMCSHV